MPEQQKIDQLRRLADEDPNDELTHFSLGSALLAAGQPQEAAPYLQRSLALNSRLSKAYHLLGKAQEAAGLRDLAIETLTNGYRVADETGDIMPMKAMGMLLTKLGATPPSIAPKQTATRTDDPGDGSFSCRRCGQGGPRLKERPFKGDLGETILTGICQGCWEEWVQMGTKVINELRLPLHEPQSQEMYDRHMREFLMI